MSASRWSTMPPTRVYARRATSVPPRASRRVIRAAAEGPASPLRLLIVDDNLQIHDDFRKILGPRPATGALEAAEAALFGDGEPVPEESAFELEYAHQGQLAAELVGTALQAGRAFSVAFIDIRMPPGWDGVQTARAIWEIDPNVQVVLCTAHSDYTWEGLVRELGASDGFLILKKPFDAIEVRQIAQALSQKWQLAREKQAALESLEDLVAGRTAELERALLQLRAEMGDRLRLEKDLRHAQKLEALGRLMAGIGHEINNPLSYVMSNLEYCQEELRRLSRGNPFEGISALSDVLEEASSGAERIRRIVNGAREFSRPFEEPVSPVDAGDCLGAAIRIVGNQLRHRATLLENVTALPRVLADPHRLEQVFVNLLMNAVESLEDNGRPRQVRVSTALAEEYVLVEVSDTGRGIPEADLERVFDPFFTTRPVGQGTGLGLWICRGIIESFGGKIELSSRLGQGTSARVLLRKAAVSTEAEARRRASLRPEVPVQRARVLVVDDEPGVLRALGRILSVHEVVTTTDARHALDLYKARPFDVVLCDLMMPGFGGVEFYDALHALGPEHARRIVLMTGGAFTEAIREFLGRVDNACVSKPFERGQLQRLIVKYTAGEALAPDPIAGRRALQS